MGLGKTLPYLVESQESRIIVLSPVPVTFLWILDLRLKFGFWTWIWDLGLGLDNSYLKVKR